MKGPKLSNPDPVNQSKRGRTKCTKPNPAPALESKRTFPPAAKIGKTSKPKRPKPNPDLPEPPRPPSPSQRRVIMGMHPSRMHGYPPPDRRGHRQSSSDDGLRPDRTPLGGGRTSDTARDMFYYVPLAQPHSQNPPHPELDLNVQRATFGAVSSVATISEKFSLLSQPRSKESARALKRCFSMHVVRGYVARGIEKRENKRRDSSYRPPLGRVTPSSSANSSPETILVPRPQWIRDAQPELSDDEADAAWRQGNKKLYGEGIHLTSHPDVSSFTGGNNLNVMAGVFHSSSGLQQAKIALHTQSDVTTCLRGYTSDHI
jgi:hypothetical protein